MHDEGLKLIQPGPIIIEYFCHRQVNLGNKLGAQGGRGRENRKKKGEREREREIERERERERERGGGSEEREKDSL